MGSKENYRTELRSAARQLGDRCLFSAAKWCGFDSVAFGCGAPCQLGARFLLRIIFHSLHLFPVFSRRPFRFQRPRSVYGQFHRTCDGSSVLRRVHSGAGGSESAATPVGGISYVSTPIPVEDGTEGDGDFYLLAKTYFDCREYRRAAHVLRKQTSKKAVFLRCYALYLAGEKRKEEEMLETEGSFGRNEAVNSELVPLERSCLHFKRLVL
ncbi:hypothetical protein HPP92_011779 [Vanilla planifolia]|uniref:Cdc23 domain-containing protein n=1 Tax=Vanilla planifolia TaxID=51239 RepID=A0A835R1F4_VANPL|nr:hypothetical protein HPP92_011779 [Vanilla planifolia]